ncbi:Fic family protein [Corynebacterium sp. ACRQP]|uniref:Fic family protein n=1 Tax=Corynebacterium sp. ACRQP TaxID=2918195 RepID=UPI001EF6C61F|nr:Fic family protein [Corynebacterium sp. ACRQP]
MGLNPGYGETPLEGDRIDALEPLVLDRYGRIPSKAELYDLETELLFIARTRLLESVDAARLSLDDILTTSFLVHLHEQLFGGIWTWAGALRRTGLNIGVDPHLISTELHTAFGNLGYQASERLLTARQLGVAAHAELVRIHPFSDGNGRVTRLMADLVFAAAQRLPHAQEYDWDLDKSEYIRLLRAYDLNRDPVPLSEFISVRTLGE